MSAGDLGPPLLEVGKPLALIAFVAASPGQSASRDALLELLWSDVDTERGKHALRQTLWYIKKKVGESVLASPNDVVSLAAPLPNDRAEMLQAAEAGHHARVIELYGGDFFPGFAAAGGVAFEQWADLERRRLRAFFLRSAEARTRQLLSLGRSREAIALARRARDSDSSNQSGWRLLFETLTTARDGTGAELEAVALEAMAEQQEFELEPATRASVRQARRQSSDADSPSTSTPSFVAEIVGREREFSVLLTRWAEVKRGRGRHVHLRAPAGIGKTRLLADLHARLRSARSRVASLRCDMGSRELPYSGASDIAAALCGLPGARGVSPNSAASLVALNPTLSTYFSPPADNSTGEEALRRRATALAELAAAVSEESPLAILIDDVHWMDAASRMVMAQVATRFSALRVFLVTTGRPTPEGRLESAESETLELSSLTEYQCAALLSGVAELPNEPWGGTLAADLWRASSGSPLHAIETLQLLMERGVLTHDGAVWTCSDEEGLRQTLRAGGALARRLSALTKPEHNIVTLLAAAGASLSLTIVCSASRLSTDAVDDALHSLERRGFVACGDAQWTLAHDEILAAIEEATTADAMRDAHRALGLSLWNENPTELRELRRAAGHLTQGDENVALESLFNRFVRVMRSMSDSRPLHALADDLLGRHATAHLARQLVRSLPLPVRVGLTSRPRKYAALLIFFLVPVTLFDVVMLVRFFAARVPDAELVIFGATGKGELEGSTVPIYANDWTPLQPVEAPRRADVRLSTGSLRWMPAEVPGRRGRWLFSATSGDSGLVDVFERSGTDAPRRLTAHRGDDLLSGFSPDGRFALLGTSRWSTNARDDIGVMNLTDGAVVPLTSGDASDSDGRWSPDGSRVAFVRHTWDDDRRRACIVFPDGSEVRCLEPLQSVTRILGWRDVASFVVEHLVGDTSALSLVSADGAQSPLRLTEGNSARAELSPDGQWLVCQCERQGHSPDAWFVMRVGRESEGRALRFGGRNNDVRIIWRGATTIGGTLGVAIRRQSGNPRVGVPHQLSLQARSASGEEISPISPRWSTDDRARANIDSVTGVLVPSDSGTVTVHGFLPGWRRTSAELNVASNAVALLIDERWERGLDQRWIPFGMPGPVILSGDGRFTLWAAGAGSLLTGVVLGDSLPALGGLAVEAEVSVPISEPRWQQLQVAITPAQPRAGSSGRSADEGLLNGRRSRAGECRIAYPGIAEGRWAADSVAGSTGSELWRTTAPGGARTGRWMRLRVQFLPDGRCGFAIDGVPFAITARASGISSHVQIQLSGQSAKTKALVGRTQVWSGVPTDIDWAAFESTRRSRRP